VLLLLLVVVVVVVEVEVVEVVEKVGGVREEGRDCVGGLCLILSLPSLAHFNYPPLPLASLSPPLGIWEIIKEKHGRCDYWFKMMITV